MRIWFAKKQKYKHVKTCEQLKQTLRMSRWYSDENMDIKDLCCIRYSTPRDISSSMSSKNNRALRPRVISCVHSRLLDLLRLFNMADNPFTGALHRPSCYVYWKLSFLILRKDFLTWKELSMVKMYWKAMLASVTVSSPNNHVRPRRGNSTTQAFVPCLYEDMKWEQ